MNKNIKNNILKMSKMLSEPIPDESKEVKDKFAQLKRILKEEQRKLDKKLSGK